MKRTQRERPPSASPVQAAAPASTIQQIADRSGVSRGTVSRILNREGHLYAPETRQRVEAAAQALAYRPHRLARALATGRTQMIGVQVVWLHTQFYARILSALEQAIAADGYQMLFQKLPEGVATAGAGIPVPGWPLDGELVVDGGSRMEGISPVIAPGRPLVSLGVYCIPTVDHVRIDVQRAASEAFVHLAAGGRRRIAYVVDQPTLRGTAEPMINAYRAFCATAAQAPRFIAPVDRSPVEVGRAVRGLLASATADERPDALFCHGDIVGHVALRVAHELGLVVPDDLAVMGCGGGDETAYQTPSLSTIRFPIAELCERAWRMLRRRLADPQAPRQEAVLAAELEVRESTSGMKTRRTLRRVAPPEPSAPIPPPADPSGRGGRA